MRAGPDGGIGRRTRFRCERSKILGSSSLLLGTILSVCELAANNGVSISSDVVSIDSKNNVCTLKGKAEVKFLKDNGEEYKFEASLMELFYNKDNLKAPERIKATGEVSFSYKGIQITAMSCFYQNKKIKFLEEVVVKDEKIGTLRAYSATYDLTSKKLFVKAKDKEKVKVNISKKV